jgi:hypothetical protein
MSWADFVAGKVSLNMDNIANLPAPLLKVVIVALGLMALFLAIKVASFMLKIVLVLIGLALSGSAVWWLFYKQ